MHSTNNPPDAMRISVPFQLFASFLLFAAAVVAGPPDGHAQTPIPDDALVDDWDVTDARGQTRTIDFEVDEGTWMSLDVSPDGQWLVFDMVFHIYRMPIGGGDAEMLTGDSGVAVNFHPRISPDGQHIAFISDRGGQNNLWVMDVDGSNARQVARDRDRQMAQPRWTPDGEYIIVRRSGSNSGLVQYHREGGEGVVLVGDDEVSGAIWPSPTADEEYLYFQASPGSGNVLQGDFQLRRYSFETGQIVDITAGDGYGPASGRVSSGGAFSPEISPDGRWLAFGRQIMDGLMEYRGHEFGPRSALWLRDLETGQERKIMDPIAPVRENRRGDAYIPLYTWTPDGNSIVIFQGGKIRRLDVESGEVSTIPFTARVQRTISEQAFNHGFRITDEPFQPRFLRWQSVSPDGSQVVFQAAGRIWIQDLPDGEPARLTPEDFDGAEFAPSWSPDGGAIAFTTLTADNRGHIWRADPRPGATPRQLTQRPAFYTHTVWSPEGDAIVATRGAGATERGRTVTHDAIHHLVEVPAGGGQATLITEVAIPTGTSPSSFARRGITQASFGPDGRIFFPQASRHDDHGNVTDLVSVRRDGSGRRVHMVFPYADEIVPSPDGRRVAFQEGDNIWLTTFPRLGTGGEPVYIDKRNGVLPIRQVSLQGGLFPKWRDDGTTLEFGNAHHHLTYNVETEQIDTLSIEFTIPQDIPEGSVAVTGATVLTMVDGQVIENGTVVAEGARITCVGTADACDTSGVDHVIDAAGKTVMPGIIDMHAHHYRENRGHRPPNDYEVAMYLAYGVTANLDNSMWSQNIFPDAERIMAGNLIGPRTYSTGDPLYAGDGARYNRIESYEDAWHNVARLKNWGAVAIKQYSYPQRDARQWLTDAGRRMDLMVTGHWNHGVIMDGHTGWEHRFPHEPMYEDMARFYGEAEAVFVPTWVVEGDGPRNIEKFFAEQDLWLDEKQRVWMPWRNLAFLRRRNLNPDTDYNYPLVAQAAADIVAHGGYSSVGGHGEHHALASHWEIWMAASAFGNMGALEVATRHGAYFLGAEEDLGTLEEGKLADLLILNSNPLDDIRSTQDIEYVMQGGRVYDGLHLDQVWPAERPFGLKYWLDDDVLLRDVRPVDGWDRE